MAELKGADSVWEEIACDLNFHFPLTFTNACTVNVSQVISCFLFLPSAPPSHLLYCILLGGRGRDVFSWCECVYRILCSVNCNFVRHIVISTLILFDFNSKTG